MKRKAFTLVELIVVITILAILWTIAFISLSWYSKEARDAKRATDTSSLLSKINIEHTRWTPISDLITNTDDVYLQILWNSGSLVKTFWEADFKILKEDEKNFRDPSNKSQNYPMAYAIGWKWKDKYNFIQIATISEKENKALIKWNYYRGEDPKDAKSLFLIWWTTQEDWKEVENWWETLPYPPTSWWNTWWWKKFSCTWTLPKYTDIFNTDNLTENIAYQNTDENGKCYFKCKETHTWDWTSCFVETWTDQQGKKWQAKPTWTAQWATNGSYTEPKWNEIEKKYDYASLWRTEEDYPAFKHCTDLWSWWRLPTKIELESLIDKDVTTGARANHPWIAPFYYWSSTLRTTTTAWYVMFINGTTNNSSKINPSFIVCIHE